MATFMHSLVVVTGEAVVEAHRMDSGTAPGTERSAPSHAQVSIQVAKCVHDRG
jgi:hypothetical protein